MTAVLADVGGTNTRLARSAGGVLDTSSIRWFRNDEHRDFASVLAAYGAKDATAMCVAIAGPVTARQARLTNRDWVIDADAYDIPVHLCNDLQAVGHALGHLPDGALQDIVAGHGAPGAQQLIVGLGTGFNVSIVAGQEVLRAELGHASLPVAVADWVMAQAGKMPFASVEALFSGKGLEALHHLTTAHPLPSASIVAEAPDSLALYGEAIGLLCTQMVFQYLPQGGIVLNGGLARAVVESAPGRKGFARGFVMQDEIGMKFRDIPVQLVMDDAAALYGCARLAERSAAP